jgi:hypothetical protein
MADTFGADVLPGDISTLETIRMGETRVSAVDIGGDADGFRLTLNTANGVVIENAMGGRRAVGRWRSGCAAPTTTG